MTSEELTKKIQDLEKQQKELEINFHRVSGAIVILKELLAKETSTTKED